MNKAFLIGNMTRDPELATTSGGSTVCKFGIAVNRAFANKAGEREVDFFNITTWNKLAENCAKFLKKGRKVAVTGRIETRTYEQDGIKKFAFDIIADDVEFLSPAEGGGERGGDFGTPAPAKAAELTPVKDDDLPF